MRSGSSFLLRPTFESLATAGLSLAIFIVGLTVPLLRQTSVGVAGISFPFLIAIGVGVCGLVSGRPGAGTRRYLRWAIPFAALALVSAVAAGTRGEALTISAVIVVWLVAIIPGLSNLMRAPNYRSSLMIGFLTGTAYYLAVVAFRLGSGGAALDERFGRVVPQLLGINRNAIDQYVLWALALAVCWPPDSASLRPTIRRTFVALSVVWLLVSGGRSGLLGLVLLVISAWVLAVPSRRIVIRLVAIVSVGVVLAFPIVSVVGPYLPGYQRLAAVESDQLDHSDEIRILLLKKAWLVSLDNPVAGIGFGNFEGYYHPVVEQAKTPPARAGALAKPAHNTFLEALVATGFPGFILFLGAVLAPLAFILKQPRSRETTALAAGYTVLLFLIAFASSFGTFLYVPIALLLSAADGRPLGDTPQQNSDAPESAATQNSGGVTTHDIVRSHITGDNRRSSDDREAADPRSR